MRRLFFIATAIVLAAAPLQADDAKEGVDHWPQWRGPLATGMSPKGDPPLKWDGMLNVKWKCALPGAGASTPIVWGDQVFLLTAIDTGKKAEAKDIPKQDPRFKPKTQPPSTYHQFIVLSVDRKSGKILWQKTVAERVPHEGHHETHTYAASSPVTDGKHFWFSFGSFGVFCYDLQGNQKWKRELGTMHTRLGWGEAASPALHGDSLVVPWDQEADSCIYCLDARSGETKWKKDRKELTNWATPLIVEHKGKPQVIVNGARARSYDLADGKILWEMGGHTINAIPTPTVADGVAYVMTGYKGALAAAVPLDATGDVGENGKSLWKHTKGTPYVPSPLLADGRLWFTKANNPMLTVLDTKTGKPVIDQERLQGLNSLYASPVGAKDRVYLCGRDGTTLVLKRGDQLEILATNRLGEGLDASPAIVGKQLFLRGEKHLYCIEE